MRAPDSSDGRRSRILRRAVDIVKPSGAIVSPRLRSRARRPCRRSNSEAATMSTPTPLSNAVAPGQKRAPANRADRRLLPSWDGDRAALSLFGDGAQASAPVALGAARRACCVLHRTPLLRPSRGHRSCHRSSSQGFPVAAALKPSVWPACLLFQMLTVAAAIAFLPPIWTFTLAVVSLSRWRSSQFCNPSRLSCR